MNTLPTIDNAKRKVRSEWVGLPRRSHLGPITASGGKLENAFKSDQGSAVHFASRKAAEGVMTRDQTQTLSPDELARRAVERRAVEAVIWGMPAVNAELMFEAMHDAKANFNQVVYWSRPVTWKNQTLTPNPDTIYVFPFFNTKDAGPMVLEIPPSEVGASITGSIDDAWQTALEDVGPAGVDGGKGGKYLILPPGYEDKAPDGYIALRSATYTGFVILRSNLTSGTDADIDKAVAYGKRIRFYPLSQVARPPATKFVDAIDVVFDSTIPYDLRFFEALDRFVQREPWLARDKVMIDQLKTIGIEKGRPFGPDAKTQKILSDAAHEAHAWIDHKYERVFSPPFNEGTLGVARFAGCRRRSSDEFCEARGLPRGRPRRRLFHGVL